MEQLRNSTTCEPMVECELYDPYKGPASILSSTLVVSLMIIFNFIKYMKLSYINANI